MTTIMSTILLLTLGLCFLSGRGLVFGIEGTVQIVHLPQNTFVGYSLIAMAFYGLAPTKLRRKLHLPNARAFLERYITGEKLRTYQTEEEDKEEKDDDIQHNETD